MKSWFFQRGYLEDLIEMETAKVNFTTLPYKKSKIRLRGTFLITYHTLL